VTPFKYSEVIFSIAVGWFVFGEFMTTAGAIGIALIIASLIAIVRLKRNR
jgi:drug/metabolite transporter (DMT)-like permease